jgi:hypothetical protein
LFQFPLILCFQVSITSLHSPRQRLSSVPEQREKKKREKQDREITFQGHCSAFSSRKTQLMSLVSLSPPGPSNKIWRTNKQKRSVNHHRQLERTIGSVSARNKVIIRFRRTKSSNGRAKNGKEAIALSNSSFVRSAEM